RGAARAAVGRRHRSGPAGDAGRARAVQRAARHRVRGAGPARDPALPGGARAAAPGVADRDRGREPGAAGAERRDRHDRMERRRARHGGLHRARAAVERGAGMTGARVAVIQFPGVNCEAESVRALERVGLGAEVFGWKRPPGDLREFDAYLLPGGFSYQDRVRAGALAAKDPLVEALATEAARGKPVLGICNGAQVLVEAGLVPGGGEVELALARNRMPDRAGYYTRWVYV